MRIVVLGAGTVGYSIADLLCREGHSVTVVDHDPVVARRANELDVRVVTGSAAQASTMFQAQVAGVDLCLAVTGNDEVNLVAASMAKAMGARRTVARVYAPVFRDRSTFNYQRHFNIDRLLSLEHLTAMEMAREIRHPGSVAIENFARGELEMQELEVSDISPIIGVPLKELEIPSSVRLGSILRDEKMIIAGAEDAVAVGDRITLIGGRSEIDKVRAQFQKAPPKNRKIIIAGGGETGYHLAKLLEARHSVCVMEQDKKRSEYLSVHLEHDTMIVNVDSKNPLVLEEEGVGACDVFAACLGDDEDNIMACVEAKELGAKRAICIVRRPDYANVVAKLGIDHTVSPREVIAKQVLGLLNTGAVISRTVLSGEEAGLEILEIEVEEESPATEAPLAQLKLPNRCLIGAAIRDTYVKVPGADYQFQVGDTVVSLIHSEVHERTVAQFSRPS